MFGLALHTSTPELGLAISDFDQLHRVQTWQLGRDLSSQLHTLLQGFLAPQRWQDLQFIAVCIGPGGFTGTRLGVVTARTLAQQLDIPLFGISALAAVAHHRLTVAQPITTTAAGEGASVKTNESVTTDVAKGIADMAITMPAKRGAVYGAVYQWTGETLVTSLEHRLFPAADWTLKQTQWPRSLVQVSLESGIGLAETTPSLLQLGYERWQAGDNANWRDVIPFYGQHPVMV